MKNHLQNAIRMPVRWLFVSYMVIGVPAHLLLAGSMASGYLKALPMEVEVTGTIVSDEGEELPGVNVLVKGTNMGTVTDINGNYRLNVPDDNAVLVFSFIGYVTQEIVVGSRTVVDVTMVSDVQALEEVVVVGYGTVRKSDLTGSVATVKADAIKEFPITSIDQALQSRVAGVNVTQTSSAPGGGLSVRIRGANSINSGSEPLYVIDGFPVYPDNDASGTDGNRTSGNALASINPNDIESIEILKDASATSIYGSRGSNGVVLITTKRGKAGETKIEYDGSYSLQQVSNSIDRLNANEYAQYRNLIADSKGETRPFSEAQINALGEGTDWMDEVLRTGSINNHQLTVSGGGENSRFAVIGNYHENEGIVIGSEFERYGVRLNLDNDLLDDFVTISSSLSYNRSITQSQTTDRQTPGDGGIIITALGLDPTVPVRDAEGNFNLVSYDGRFDINPVQEALNIDDTDFTNRFLGNTGVTFHLSKDLSFKTSIGADVLNANRVTFYGSNTYLGRQRSGDLQNFSRYSTNLLNENILSYSRQLSPLHFIDVVAGYTYQHVVNRFTSVSTRNVAGTSVENVRLQDGTSPQIPSSGRVESVLKSFLTRINYKFKDRYLLTFTMRRDGASVFSEDNKWSNFPSVALGWRVIDEPFLQDNKVLSNLKLRASYGVTGNSNVPAFSSFPAQATNNYVFGETSALVTGKVEDRLGNDALKWESTKMLNIGIDAGFLEDRLTLTMDYFRTTTDDLLLNIALPPSLGFESVLKNSGSLENNGLELGLNYIAIDNGNLRWDISGNISFLNNEIKDLGDSGPFFAPMLNTHLGVNGSWVEPGQSIGVWRGYRFIGLFQDQTEIDNNASLPGDKPGSPRYLDSDDDGDLDSDDWVILGNPNPDVTWGFNTSVKYKKFDLAIFLRGVHGNEVRNLQASELADGTQIINQVGDMLSDSWTPDNRGANRPIIDGTRDFAGFFRDSDYFVEDGSFVRVQNIAIGYTLPELRHITRLRVYISAQNPWVFTDYSGFDPEVNNQGQNNLNRADDYDAYPRARIFTFGINMGL
ncbi:TonB-dependent receptor [Fulvivirga sp. M361]|uniref:SusC/RagA family TonB-linked outer membrane protein n=1 Tax=Fulvivirga sp. M361 TaxID=2594266 RepID=UPI00117B9E1A|nr:TonB-dependent receptor [Fulvivirga sp. M361]TRX51316.1 TonB-dependent receptor [Fulvivirga sp. M361]